MCELLNDREKADRLSRPASQLLRHNVPASSLEACFLSNTYVLDVTLDTPEHESNKKHGDRVASYNANQAVHVASYHITDEFLPRATTTTTQQFLFQPRSEPCINKKEPILECLAIFQ